MGCKDLDPANASLVFDSRPIFCAISKMFLIPWSISWTFQKKIILWSNLCPHLVQFLLIPQPNFVWPPEENQFDPLTKNFSPTFMRDNGNDKDTYRTPSKSDLPIPETCDPCNLWPLMKINDISHNTNIHNECDPSMHWRVTWDGTAFAILVMFLQSCYSILSHLSQA